MRKDWDSYFMDVARLVASRSTCDRKHVGCVLVRDKHIIATGYNGSMPGLSHCDDVGHLMIDGGCKRTNHAEANAIAQAAMHGHATKDATAYCTLQPCLTCAKLLVMAGIGKVVFEEEYRDPSSLIFLKACKIPVMVFVDGKRKYIVQANTKKGEW